LFTGKEDGDGDGWHIAARDYLACMAKATYQHPSGACAMLPRNEGGVVELRIYRVQGLRVVGTSVFPAVPQGNPQSLVYTVAREAVDIIKVCSRTAVV
jgi:choline dehydrogenase-like flavoprotein